MKRLISLLFLLALFTYALAASSTIGRAQFTTGISNNEPVNSIQHADTSTTTLIFFTDINNCKGCTVVHRWFHNGKQQFELSVIPTSHKYRWWTQINPSGLTGTWRVDVFVNGDIQTSGTVAYGAETAIQKQLQRSLDGECEEKLKYFHDQVRQHPDDPYYEFMFRKWGSRCYVK